MKRITIDELKQRLGEKPIQVLLELGDFSFTLIDDKGVVLGEYKCRSDLIKEGKRI